MLARTPEEMREDIVKTLRDYADNFEDSITVESLVCNMADLINDVSYLNCDLTDTMRVYKLEREIDED